MWERGLKYYNKELMTELVKSLPMWERGLKW